MIGEEADPPSDEAGGSPEDPDRLCPGVHAPTKTPVTTSATIGALIFTCLSLRR
jgi:hypothetical protein